MVWQNILVIVCFYFHILNITFIYFLILCNYLMISILFNLELIRNGVYVVHVSFLIINSLIILFSQSLINLMIINVRNISCVFHFLHLVMLHSCIYFWLDFVLMKFFMVFSLHIFSMIILMFHK
jgi:hypothetical protein